jgi:hypothetical protein
MVRFASFASFAGWIFSVLFTGIVIPVAAEFLKKWLAGSGAYEHPESAFGWVMNHLSAFAQLSWVFPTALILGGLAMLLREGSCVIR